MKKSIYLIAAIALLVAQSVFPCYVGTYANSTPVMIHAQVACAFTGLGCKEYGGCGGGGSFCVVGNNGVEICIDYQS